MLYWYQSRDRVIASEYSAKIYTVTDAIRCLYLEAYGYTTRLQEFVDPEHTARNLLMIATKSARNPDHAGLLRRAKEFQKQFGVKTQRLAELLNAAENAERELRSAE